MSSKLNLGIRCYAYMRGGSLKMLTELKADMVSFASNTVWSMSERPEAKLSACGTVQVIRLTLTFFTHLFTSDHV